MIRTDASARIDSNRQLAMNDDPNQIADHLIEDHGIDGAFVAVREGINATHANGDNYRLSVWREVKQALEKKRDTANQT